MGEQTTADPTADATRETVERFNEAFNRHDVDTVMQLMTVDCVFEDTAPPDGIRHVGHRAVRACWQELFASSPQARFDAEELLVAGNRAVVRWSYRWSGADPADSHVRGVDVIRVRDGKVAEKLSYVKG